MSVEVIYVELLYYGVIVCTALFSISSMSKEKKKKKMEKKKREKKRMEKNLDPFSECFGRKRKEKLERNILRNNQFSNEMKDSRISFVLFFYQRKKRKKI